MTDKKKIVAEINRRLEAQDPLGSTEKDVIESNVYFSLLKYIDSIPEESTSKDLEEAAINYAHEQGLKQISGEWESKKAVDFQADHGLYFHIDIINAFKTGANWQKEQMMKNSVEGEVTVDYWDAEDREVDVILADDVIGEEHGIKDDDKVKLIIVKED